MQPDDPGGWLFNGSDSIAMYKSILQATMGRQKDEQDSLGPPGSHEAFIYSFNKYILNTYYLLGTVLGTGNTAINKADQIPQLYGGRDKTVET